MISLSTFFFDVGEETSSPTKHIAHAHWVYVIVVVYPNTYVDELSGKKVVYSFGGIDNMSDSKLFQQVLILRYLCAAKVP